MTKPAPKLMPDGPKEMYAYLSYEEKYEGEGDDDFQSRKNLLEAFHKELADAGLTLETLWMLTGRIALPRSVRTKTGKIV